jgi:hypothetical protein
LKGFKKARFDNFDIATLLEFTFHPLKYSVQLPKINPPTIIQHFYQECLSKDEISELAQKVARFFFEAVKEKADGHV